MTEPGLKRKRPPTFQHFPEQQAKKLKKTWVKNAKIRSQWKAEKRKQMLAQKPKLDLPKYDNEEDEEDKDEDEDNKDVKSDVDARSESPDDSENEQNTEEKESSNVVQAPNIHHSVHPSRSQLHSKRASRGPKQELTRPHNSKQNEKGNEEQLSVRELTRLAYSQSTLHTFKSDPLHRRRERSSRGGDRERGRGGGGGGGRRGQPDMKLRMNAMLAKIKQDLGS